MNARPFDEKPGRRNIICLGPQRRKIYYCMNDRPNDAGVAEKGSRCPGKVVRNVPH